MIQLLILIGMLIFFLYTPQTNYCQPKFALLSVLSVAMLCWGIFEVSNWPLGLFFFILLFSSLRNAIYPLFGKWQDWDFLTALESSKTSIAVLSMGLVFLFSTKDLIENIFQVIPYMLILNAIFKIVPEKYRMLTSLTGHKYPLHGLGGNTSVDASLVSIMCAITLMREYPFAVKELGIIATAFCLYKNRGTAGILGFVFSAFPWAIYTNRLEIAVPIAYGMALAIIKDWKFLSKDSGRWVIWNHMWKNIVSRKTMLFGVGNGSYKLYMPHAGGIKIENSSVRVEWAHNDLFQLFVETGIVGIASLVLFLFSIVPMMEFQHWIVLIALLPNIIFNFSMHMAPDCFLIILSLKEMFLCQKN